MFHLAWRNLAQSRIQFILGVGGVALALLLMLALVIQLLLFGVWTAAGIPDFEPFEILSGDNLVFVWLRLIVGLAFPLLLTAMAYRTSLTRSMESATGLLYIEFALVMASTIVAAGLLFGEGLLV